MNDDDLERLLAESFDRRARGAVDDGTAPPRPRFRDPQVPHRRRVVRWAAPLAAAAAVLGVVIGIAAVRDPGAGTDGKVADRPGPLVSATSTAPDRPASTPPTGSGPHTAVHVSLLNADHSVVGVGMPVIAYFSQPITDAGELSRATTLTVNGKPATGAWYFERSARPGYPVEGHFRMQDYWPADAEIRVSLPVKGLPAGGDYAFDDSLTLDFATGASQVATVDDRKHVLYLQRDGHRVGSYPVSLGAASTPTTRGVKVIMDKGADIAMRGPGYQVDHVRWTQRLTYDGEYLHAAPWNTYNIDHGVDSSNGCTNLMPGDAKSLYDVLRVGDVVRFPNTSGPPMTMGEGYGDWNVPWRTWLTGGAVPTG